MAPPLLSLRDIHLTFGGPPLLEGAELFASPGERIVLVGRNGSGKSTLLKIAAGQIEADRGERFVSPGATIHYLPQEPDLSAFPTALDAVLAALGPADDPHRARFLLETLGLTGAEAPGTLSGGEARRVALARALAPEPDVLLLDEPTNHLDLPAIEWLEGELRSLKSAIVLISHDRRFLEALSRATVWLDRGRTRRLEQSFAAFEGWRDAVLEEEERDRHKLDRQIVREEHWMRYGVTARRKRNERRVRELAALRERRRTERRAQGTVKLTVGEAETSGKLVIEAIGVTKRWGERVIVKDLAMRIARGDRIGLVGPNGAGKTTLIGLLTGTLPPDAGTVRLGTNLDIVTLDQTRESIDPTMPLREAIAEGRGDTVTIGGESRHVMSYLQDFLFAPEQARTPVGALSGGERGRLMLARALAKPSNLMVLDEPTNDLDLETLDLLQEMIADYPGTVLIVSHDRDFLDRTVSSVLAWESDGVWTEYAGGYTDMIAQRGTGVRARTVAPQGSKAPGPVNPQLTQNTERSVPKRKLSFKDKHALDTLPKEIEKLSAEIIRLETKLADASLYTRAPEEAKRLGAELTAAIAERERLETAWLELAIEAEALGDR